MHSFVSIWFQKLAILNYHLNYQALVVLGIWIVVCLFVVVNLKKAVLKDDFFNFSFRFLAVFLLATVCLVAGCFKVYPFWISLFVLLLTILWAILLRKQIYVKSVFPLNAKAYDFNEFFIHVKASAKAFTILGMCSLCLLLFPYGFSLICDELLDYSVKSNMAFETLRAYIISLGLVYLLLVCILAFFGTKWLLLTFYPQKKGLYANRLFCRHGVHSLTCFFRKQPKAKGDPFVIFLAGLTLLRCVTPAFALLAGLSIRLDSGLSFACLSWLYLAMTYIVSAPLTQNHLFKAYGSKCLRFLGWNGPEMNLLPLVRNGVIIGVGVKALWTAGHMANDTLNGAKEIHQDNVDAKVKSNKNNLIAKSNTQVGIPNHTPFEKLAPKPKPPKWPWST